MSIESGGYFGSNSAEEQPHTIPRYHLDRCEPVMDRDDEDGEYCKWDDVQGFVEYEPCEGCHLPPVSCQRLTLKQACEKIYALKKVLECVRDEDNETDALTSYSRQKVEEALEI